MGLRKDIWRPAIVMAPLEEIVRHGSIDGLAVHWLPSLPSFRFLADPFGLWRDDRLHIFVETFDYRDRIGRIEVLTYDADLTLLSHRPALAEPWHLSYPHVFEAAGETWMLPEAHRSGGLTVYRAVDFPHRWERAYRLDLPHAPVDATPFFHDGLWWLFYTAGATQAGKMGALHVAFSERLEGPWRPLPGNPIRTDIASARPGGTVSMIDGRPMLPVQDCSSTYGGAIRPLWFDRLSTSGATMEAGPPITAPPGFAPFTEGLHTLSAAGRVTLIDAKRTELSLHGLSIEISRSTRRLARRLVAPR